ncbi:hypothetical protein L6452_24255 [Arctium lappa]|uniref:Uncharacterized protein n=1 Tax=Arctium lappa TaxID=4217 RepID=A0ACB9A8F4_ARCLA|nr:hypothetical protein L6452_24255 [Arctium lappa]
MRGVQAEGDRRQAEGDRQQAEGGLRSRSHSRQRAEGQGCIDGSQISSLILYMDLCFGKKKEGEMKIGNRKERREVKTKNEGRLKKYDVALAINTLGSKHVSDFVNECFNMKLLLHVSTAYVSGEKAGIILETPFKMGETLNGKNDLNIREENNATQERLGQLQVEKADEEAVSSAMKDFGIQRTIDGYIATYGKGRISCFLADPLKVLDMIPADMVVNAMFVAMAAHINQPYSNTIYHVGSSMSNPFTVSRFRNCILDYFAKHPLINKQGKPIKIGKKIKLLSSMSSFYRYMDIRYKIPLKGLKYANLILGGAFTASYLDADRKIKTALRFAKLFRAYVLIRCM